MKKTGQLLREAREAKRISLQEVSIHLKISSRILRALEEGDKEQLPAKTFLRGFVQSYAQFLRLEGSEVLELFQAEMGTTHPKMITKNADNLDESNIDTNEKINNSKVNALINTTPAVNATTASDSVVIPINSNPTVAIKNSELKNETSYSQSPMAPLAPSLSIDQKTWSRSMKIGTLAIIVIIAVVIYGVVKTIEKYEREGTIVKSESELEVLPRTEPDNLAIPITPENTTLSQEKTLLNQDVATDGSPVDLAAISNENAPLPEDAKLNNNANSIPAVTATSTPTNPATTPVIDDKKELKEVASTIESKPIQTDSIPPVSRPQEVIIEALDKVTIEYSIDDKAKATLVLNAEKVHTFKGDKKLSLGFSDGGSINLIYNGKDKGVPGNLGKPLQLKFPE